MKKTAACLFACLLVSALAAQQKPLNTDDILRWRKIHQPQITQDGQWIAYVLAPTGEGDSTLCLFHAAGGQTTRFERAGSPRFSEDGQWLAFRVKAPLDTLKAQRRRKVKDEDLPKDTLALYHLASGKLEKIPRLRAFSLPEKWSGWLLYQQEAEKPPKKDGGDKNDKGKKLKKEGKDTGSRLYVRHLPTGRTDTVAYVQTYTLAKRAPRLLLHTGGFGDTMTFAANPAFRQAGVYWLDLERNTLQALFRQKGKFQQLSLDELGGQAAFLADTDTTKARVRPWQLAYWAMHPTDTARILAGPGAAFLPRDWGLSEHARPVFSEDAGKLYFGMAPPPVLPDTTLLPEEIVHVEVWAWTEGRLYTQQKNRLEADRKRSYPAVWHARANKIVPLGSPDLPEWRFQEQRDADYALAFTEEPYTAEISWEGTARRDVYAVDVRTGQRRALVQGKRLSPSLSPAARYIAWWSDADTTWNAAPTATAGPALKLTDNRLVAFYDEETDVPDYPDPHGTMGWLENDEALFVYDRYDIWKLDPAGRRAPERITRGREQKTVYRYLKLDPEERAIKPGARLLLHRLNETTKAEGYAWLDLKTNTVEPWMGGDFAYTKQPVKAKKASRLLFTRQNFNTFPDLLLADMDARAAEEPRRVSDANPWQAEYAWGSIELVEWTSLSGQKLQGLLVKPAGFDPKKQYPMVVNFYERLTDGLHQHRAPDFHRSTINYTVYASRGYLVFAPDIPYRVGYPGESAYDAVVSGVTSLLDRGFVDPRRVGLQGHSWGGYQAAYLVTRTNLFACAEAGAPVANMTSAYGGIRWESGLSRVFQYERQQSRIGGSLWEYPMRYLENSPLFSLDKVQTPVLVLHNDKDGAVPWYQGIELYTGLKRLGKPTWLLNYNDEPHWPVKLQNRVDFQTRMLQFFDHYLQGAPAPRWMRRGVPPVEKGINSGLETVD